MSNPELSDSDHKDIMMEMEGTVLQRVLGSSVFPVRSGLSLCLQWSRHNVSVSYDKTMVMVAGNPTVIEILTFDKQLQAATALLAKPSTATAAQKALLNDLLVPGEKAVDLAKVIIKKDEGMSSMIGEAGGIKRNTEYALKQLEAKGGTVDEVKTVMADMQAGYDKLIAASKKANDAAKKGGA